MAYKACFNCDLLFEVDTGAGSPCPQCGGPLEDYTPETDELVGAGEPATPGGNPGIVSTMAFDGLGDSVRQDLAARRQAPPAPELADDDDDDDDDFDGGTLMLEQVAPAAPMPAPRPASQPPLEKTRALEVPIDQIAAGALPGQPTTPDGPTPAPAPRKKRLYGELGGGDDDVVRKTRVADVESLRGELPPRLDPAPAPRPAPRAAPKAAPRPAAVPAPRNTPVPPSNTPPVAVSSARRTKVSDSPGHGSGRSKLPLIIAAVVVLAGGGAAAWYFTQGDDAEKSADGETGAPEVPWTQQLAQQLEEFQAMTPVVLGAVPLEETTYIAGGPEGLTSSTGSVPGLPSTAIADTAVQKDAAGEWVRALKRHLGENTVEPETPLAMAFNGDMQVKNLLRLTYSAWLAGHRRFGLVVGREDAPGELGMLPYRLVRDADPLPAGGAVVTRIGRTGFHVTAKDGQGKVVSEGDPKVERHEGSNALDLSGLGERIDALRAAHPDVTTVHLHAIGDMKLDDLAGVMSTLLQEGKSPRFSEVVLVL